MTSASYQGVHVDQAVVTDELPDPLAERAMQLALATLALRNAATADVDLEEIYLGLGGSGTGLTPHEHAAAWAFQLSGRKWWAIWPPAPECAACSPGCQAGSTEAARDAECAACPDECSKPPRECWGAPEAIKRKRACSRVQRCLQRAGDLLYMPGAWLHETWNIDPAVTLAVHRLTHGAEPGP